MGSSNVYIRYSGVSDGSVADADSEGADAGVEYAIGDCDVLAGEFLIFEMGIRAPQGDGIVASADDAVGDDDALAAVDVDAVSVGMVDGVVDVEACCYDIGAAVE